MAVSLVLVPAVALAHEERPVELPAGDGAVPAYRSTGPLLVVCRPDSLDRILAFEEPHRSRNLELLAACGFEHVQAAVDAVAAPGSRIAVLPGVYREEPSLAPESESCAALERPLSYEETVECPHHDNLVAVLGDGPDADRRCTTERLCRLQIEGTGPTPHDVVVDAAWNKLNAIRFDRADGSYLANMVVQRTDFNSVYVLEQDGFVIDRVVARWNYEYGILTFAVDHGLYVDCEAYGNGDSGLYPGSASGLQGARWSVEITRCNSHHNTLGYSGTAGDSVYAHDNDFHDNAVGASMDSFFPNHPGLPQNSARFVGNRIYSNNVNYYDNWLGEDAPCRRPLEERGIEEGIVCPVVPVPVGTGILLAGGNDNVYAQNRIWDNWRYGGMQIGVPAPLREEYDPLKAYDTSHRNRWVANVMGLTPAGDAAPNGLDFWWDEEGSGNCWEGNVGGKGGVTMDPPPPIMPTECAQTQIFRPPNPMKLAPLVPCATFSAPDNTHPPGCDWMTTPPNPRSDGGLGVPAPTAARTSTEPR